MLTGTAAGKTYRAQALPAQATMRRNWPCCTITDAQQTIRRTNRCVYLYVSVHLCVEHCLYNPKFFLLPCEIFKFLKKIGLSLEPFVLKPHIFKYEGN